MSKPFRWEARLKSKIVAEGEHGDRREARRALHRKMRSLRLMVITKKADLTGIVMRHDGVVVWRSKMTPQSVMNPTVRWIIYQQVGIKANPEVGIGRDIR